MDFSEKEAFISNHFLSRGFERISDMCECAPKLIVNIFDAQVCSSYAHGNKVAPEYIPDFTIVKRSKVSYSHADGQIVRIEQETLFSLWKILEGSSHPFPFVPVTKDDKVIRVPFYRRDLGFWYANNTLLVR